MLCFSDSFSSFFNICTKSFIFSYDFRNVALFCSVIFPRCQFLLYFKMMFCLSLCLHLCDIFTEYLLHQSLFHIVLISDCKLFVRLNPSSVLVPDEALQHQANKYLRNVSGIHTLAYLI